MDSQELTIEDIKSRAVKGIAALTGRTFILQAIGLVATFLLTIFLSPSEYGTFFLVSAVVNFFAYFSDIGLAAALIQKKEPLSSDELKTTFTVQQILVITLVVIIFAITPFLQSFYKLSQGSVFLIWSLALSLFLSSLKTIPSVLLERKLDFKRLIIPQIVETLLFNLVCVSLAWRGFGIQSYTFGVLIRGISGLILMYALSPWMPGFKFSTDALKRLLKYGLPYQANTFLAVFKDDGMTAFLGGIIGSSGIGYLGWAQKWAQAPLRFFMDQVIKVTFPAYSRLQHDPKTLSQAVNKSLLFISLLVFPSILGLIILAPLITQVVPKYGKWQPALLALSLVSINTIFASVTTPLTNLLNAIGKIKITFRFMIMWTALTWTLIPLLSLKFGFNGAALGYVLVGLSSTVAIFVATKYVDVNLWNNVAKPLLAAIFMGAIIYLLSHYMPVSFLSVIILIFLGLLIFFATVILFFGRSILVDGRKIFQSLLLILVFIGFLSFPKPVSAAVNQFITIVNPVRGADFFQLENAKPSDNFIKQFSEIQKRNLSATWLIRPDALSDTQITELLRKSGSNQEAGLFLEVTPSWANMAQVGYRKSQNWHFAGSVFLTGYEVEERKKLIDAAFENFKKTFGYFPKSVGAWWIDAESLSYMREKYGVVANMDVADQYSTDNYQVWGQYFSTPFYPAKRNALMPASSEEQKIGVVTVQWATRDPYNSFGNGVLDSTYSVQSNDYANKLFHTLDTEYFKKLLSVYLDNPYNSFGQVTVGLENDFSWDQFGQEYQKQLDVVSLRKKSGTEEVTLSQFAERYSRLFPKLTPPSIIFTQDPLGSGGYVLWYQNPKYRLGWFSGNRGSLIKDLRLFFDSHQEPCLEKRCDILNLATAETGSIDDVTYGNGWVVDEGRVSDIKVKFSDDRVELTYTNQTGLKRDIKFLPNDINLDGQALPIQVWISRALDHPSEEKKTNQFNFGLINPVGQIGRELKGFVLFILFCFVAFYLPGLALLKKADLSKNDKFVLAIPLGIALFTFLTFVFEYLKFSWGIVILPLASLIYLKKAAIPGVPKINGNWPGVLLIIAGSLSWLATSLKSGLQFDYGLGFWGPLGHDGIWHLGLIEAIKHGLPAKNPAFAGETLNNYHYFYDLLLAQTSNLTTLLPIDLYFRFFPILISLTLGGIVYMLAKRWFSSNLAANWSVFFIYFGGSMGWILSYFRNRSLGGETAFWAQQSISTLINPPFAISLLLFLTGLYLFYKISEQKSQVLPFLIPLIFLWGTLIEFKAYAGILVLAALAVVSTVEVFKRNFRFLVLPFSIGILSAVVFLPNNTGSSSLLIFSPFWLIHSMIDSPDRVGWFRLQLARVAGEEGGNWFKFLGAEAVGLLIFIGGNLGTRLVGFLAIGSLYPRNKFNLFVLSFLIFAVIIPLLFIQKGASFNSIQFFYYSLALSDFLAAAGLYYITKKLTVIGVGLAIFLVLLTVPTTWDSLGQYLPARPPARISNFEKEALEFLRLQPDGIVLSYIYDKNLKTRFSEPVPLFAYESTMYVAALSGKSEYIADTVNLTILDVDYKGRLQVQKDIVSLKEPEMVKKLLVKNNIKYIYLPKIAKVSADNSFGLEKIFENDEILIYKNIL